MGYNFIADNADVGVFSGLDMVIAGIEWAGHDENNAQSVDSESPQKKLTILLSLHRVLR